MILTVVAVWDRAAASYGRPFFSHTKAMAIRSFIDEVKRVAPDNPMAAHPEDYDLYFLGTWEDEKGLFDQSEGSAKILVAGRDVIPAMVPVKGLRDVSQ